RLVAYLVRAGSVEPPAPELRALVAQTLPDYMVPAAFVTLEALPLNPNGKLDRRALPAPEFAAAASAYVAPRNDTERMLADIWAQVLRVERVGVEDNFFELGGDSILSIAVVSRARQAGLGLMPRDLFRYPTVATLAAGVVGPALVLLAEQGPVVGPVPLTPGQRGGFGSLASPGRFEQ